MVGGFFMGLVKVLWCGVLMDCVFCVFIRIFLFGEGDDGCFIGDGEWLLFFI